MTEQEANSVAGAAAKLGTKLIGSLPAQFLMLCLLNLVFIAGLLWFLDEQIKARERVLTPLITACLQHRE